jgi:hypothetical protein
MPEVLTCPSCQRKLQVPETLIGQDVQCPTCGATFLAQVGGSSPGRSAAPQRDEPPSREMTRSSRRDADDYDDRPSRSSRRDMDDYDDRPSRVRRRRRSDYEPHRGPLILTLGIVSFFVGGPILGAVAWILGNADMAAIRAGRMDPEGEGMTNAGRICGMISVILGIIGLVLCVAYFVCVLAIIGTAGTSGGKGFK